MRLVCGLFHVPEVTAEVYFATPYDFWEQSEILVVHNYKPLDGHQLLADNKHYELFKRLERYIPEQ